MDYSLENEITKIEPLKSNKFQTAIDEKLKLPDICTPRDKVRHAEVLEQSALYQQAYLDKILKTCVK